MHDPNNKPESHLSPVERRAYKEKNAPKQTRWHLRDGWIHLKEDLVDIQDEGGEKHTHKKYVVLHCGGVGVLPFIDPKTVLLVKQYRYPIDEILLEVPAGRIDEGEDPLEAAQRELQEETHYKAQKIEPLGTLYPSPGFCTEKVYVYAAHNLTRSPLPKDLGEVIELIALPFTKALEKVKNGEINDAKTAFALLQYATLFP